MSRLENEIFQSRHPLLPCISLWRRYVDDVFCVWTGTDEQVSEFLQFLNSIYPSIKFTSEIGGSKINFLDLTISLLPDSYSFSIYRKNTATDILINGSSFCPFPHKLAAFNYYVHRLVTLPLSQEAYKEEASTLRHLASVNSINIDIDALIRKKETKVALQSTTTLTKTPRTPRRKKNVPLPYLPQLTSKLSEVLKTINRPPAFYPLLQLRRLLPNGKDSTPPC